MKIRIYFLFGPDLGLKVVLRQSQICRGLNALLLTSGFLGVQVNDETRITINNAPKHVPTRDAAKTATNPAFFDEKQISMFM